MTSQTNGSCSSALPGICLQRDLSKSSTLLEIKKRHEEVLRPGANEAVDVAQLDISPDGKYIAGAATICEEMKGSPTTRLVLLRTDAKGDDLQQFGKRKGSDTYPKFSPDGSIISFLSQVDGNHQLHSLDLKTGGVIQCTKIDGTIERQSWSQDGSLVLLTVAGLGADRAGAEGGVSHAVSGNREDETESWLPKVDRAAATDTYRTLWTYNIKNGNCQKVSPEDLNVWEAVWISPTKVVGICSDLPGEDYWYTSSVREIDLSSKVVRNLFTSEYPVEDLAASPSGSRVAFVNGIASDRQVLKGDLYMLEMSPGKATRLDTKQVDIGGSLHFCGDDDIVATGTRADEEIIMQYDCKSGEMSELWKDREHSNGTHHTPEAAAKLVNGEVQFAFVKAGWFDPPTLVHGTRVGVSDLKTLGSPSVHGQIRSLGSARNISWKAPDGLEIHGYVLTPSTTKPGPLPTILVIHGGPVSHWRPRYIGGHGQAVVDRSFLASGFAIFKPNVRGSSGRGQDFIRHVYGDMGGKDTYDYLSGLDYLVKEGISDPKRLGTYGGSYGGFMSSWLITQSPRFAAAVPVAPCTDWVSLKYTTNIGIFVDDFLASSPHDPNGKFFSHSPIHHVDKVTTPTLTIVGGVDSCTPPTQGVEFHKALVMKGIPSVLLTYPEEGHGVRQMPALFDYVARTTEWFRHYLS